MSNEILKKHELDLQKTLEFFLSHISGGEALSQKTLKEIDFKKGRFFTFLPHSAILNRIYEFTYGGIIPPVPDGSGPFYIAGRSTPFYPQSVFTTLPKLNEFVFDFLQKEMFHFAIVENLMDRPGSKYGEIENVTTCIYDNEVCYLLNKKNSIEEVNSTLRKTLQIWHSLILLVDMKQETKLQHIDLNITFQHVQYVLIEAYDGEGFLVWESGRNKS